MENKNTLGLTVEDSSTPMITKQYSVDIETYKTGFKLFQKMYAKKRNIIFTVCLSLICANSVYQMIVYPDYASTCVLMILVCISLIFIIWNNARLLNKNFGRSLDNIKGDIEKDKYEFKLFDSYLTISSEIYISDEEKKELREQMESDEAYEKELDEYIHPPQTVFNLETDNMKIIENDKLFIIFEKKSVFYTLPKCEFSEDEIALMEKVFSLKLGKCYNRRNK